MLEERLAFLRMRNFLRRVFKTRDLPKLRVLFPFEDDGDFEKLKMLGVFYCIDKFDLAVNFSKLQDPEIFQLYKKVARGRMNREFIFDVESAVQLSKEEYVEEMFRVRSYSSESTKYDMRRSRRKWRRHFRPGSLKYKELRQKAVDLTKTWRR